MFKTGGSTNSGIMHGLVDRKRYSTAGIVDEERLGADVSAIKAAMDKYAPISKPRFPLGEIGLRLASGQYAGEGLLQNIAGSAMDPYREWTKADDARSLAESQRTGSAISSAIGQQFAERTARAKAAGQNGFLKKETVEGAFDHFLEENAKSANELKGYEKPNLSQKYQVGDAEFKSYVWRNLKTTTNSQGQEVERNYVGFVPFDVKNQEFSYDTMMPGMYYYDPNIRAFVQRIPEDGKDTYFKYDKMTFEKYVMDTSTKPPSWKKLETK